MTSRTHLFIVALAGGTLACSASAQQSIFSATFDNPPYSVGTLIGQQAWAAGGAATTANPTRVRVSNVTPAEGNGKLITQSWDSAAGAWAGFSSDQLTGTAFASAISAGAQFVDTAFKFNLPATSSGPSVHFLGVYALSGTSLLAQCGFQVFAGAYAAAPPSTFAVVPGELVMVQRLDPPLVTTAGNYLLKFDPPVVLTPGSWNDLALRWNPLTNTPSFKVGSSDWIEGYTINTPLVNNRIRVGCSPYLTTNTVSSEGNFDSLNVTAVLPAYPQCTTSAGDCDVAHPTGGCNIISCCETVCNLNSACCDVEWDAGCVDIAIPECQLFVYSCSNPGVPSNNCAISPTVVNSLPVTLAYDTTTATTDGPPEVGCGSADGDLPIHKDVWYRIQAPTDGNLIASNCNGGGFGGTGDFDSKIAAYDLGTNLAAFDPQLLPDLYIGCNEDCAEDGAGAFTSTLNQSGIVAGHYYLVRLGGYAGQSGSGDLFINVQPPPNPCDPANLIQGVAGVNVVTVDTLYGDLDFTGTSCNFPLGDEKIYNAKFIKYTSPGSGVLEIENCSDTGTEVDSRFAVLTSCGVVSSVIGCDDDGCTGGTAPYTSSLQVNVTANTTYYIAVGGFDDGQAGPFNVNIIPPSAPACPADLNQDGTVNGADLGLMLGAWGACPGCAADLNADGVVNGADLGLLLGSWGACV